MVVSESGQAELNQTRANRCHVKDGVEVVPDHAPECPANPLYKPVNSM